MSLSTRSAGVLPSSPSASRPLPASPTTTSGNAPAQSSRSSRNLRRAGASSSTTSIFSGVSDTRILRVRRCAIWHPDVHFVAVLAGAAFEARLRVKVQRQTLPDVVHRHLVPGVVTAGEAVRIAQDCVNLASAQENVDRDDSRRARRLDAVIHRV